MPFQCCLNSDNVVEDTGLQEVETKIPKSIDLNQGYYNNIEFLIFNRKPDIPFNIQRPVTPENFQHTYNSTPVTLLETRISSILNTDLGHSVAETTSSVIISGSNSPIQLLAKVGIPDESNQKINSNVYNSNYDSNKVKGYTENFLDKIGRKSNSDNDNNELNSKIDSEPLNITDYIKTEDCKSEINCELELDKTKNKEFMEAKTDFDENQLVKTNKTGIENEYVDIKSIKSDICELIQLSNKLLEKKAKLNNKKAKKTINIEITLTPKNENNVFIDAHEFSKNSTRRTKYDISEPLYKKNDNELFVVPGINTSEKETHKNEFRIQEMESTLCENADSNIGQLTNNIIDKVIQNQEQNMLYENEMTDLFTSKIDKTNELESTKLNKLSSISSDKFIPFIEDYESFNNDKKKINTEVELKNKSINNGSFSTVEIKDINSLDINTRKVDEAFPSINFDPQFAQLFASAQIHVDEIKKNQSIEHENDNFIDESDPIKIIKNFLEDPSGDRDRISWSTVKAAIDVYKPQIEYAEKELEKWKNCAKKDLDDSVRDNIEYYSDLLKELKEKIDMAERAKTLIVNESNKDEIDKMLEVEQNYLEEIKENMRNQLNELKAVEDEYLNGKAENKEIIVSFRKKIRELENEIKNKLVQIHKLKSLQGLHENI
ncbi:hypothetical protein RS030_2218 [Cryptosporidium xiaoi]|uniref:Uncharacterized protein n=1 Tax=Cryptosporidium xiaoi TaxID=659607 RepID=A0AAV9Y249_9CRYT